MSNHETTITDTEVTCTCGDGVTRYGYYLGYWVNMAFLHRSTGESMVTL